MYVVCLFNDYLQSILILINLLPVTFLLELYILMMWWVDTRATHGTKLLGRRVQGEVYNLFFFSQKQPKLYLFNYFGTSCVPKIPGGCVAVSSPGRSRSMIEICFARADRRSKERMKRRKRKREIGWRGATRRMEKERERITGRVQTDRVENPLLY